MKNILLILTLLSGGHIIACKKCNNNNAETVTRAAAQDASFDALAEFMDGTADVPKVSTTPIKAPSKAEQWLRKIGVPIAMKLAALKQRLQKAWSGK